MKTNLLLTVISLIVSFNLSSQTLEHTYTTGGNPKNKSLAFLTETGLKYYTINAQANQVSFYNSAHNNIKTINITLPGNEAIRTLDLVTDKLFNTDSKIEFIVKSETFNMYLFNEDGTQLFSFGNREDVFYMKDENNNFKLIVANGGEKENTTTYEVYGLTGSLSTSQEALFADKSLMSYPNPATSVLNITNPLKQGEHAMLHVYNTSGKQVLEKNIISDEEDSITLDISSLQPGIYIYKIGSYSNKFVKN